MSTEPVHLTYVGPARGVGMFAQMLEEQGAESVRYSPPMEYKSLDRAAEISTVVMTVLAAVPVIRQAAQDFRSRFPGARVNGVPEAEAPTLEERLRRLDELLEAGTITTEEHASQRARILDEAL